MAQNTPFGMNFNESKGGLYKVREREKIAIAH